MKTFEEYLDKMGYGWNDFDRTYEMENLIEQYADEKIKQALSIADVVGQSEQLVCDCDKWHDRMEESNNTCSTCDKPIN
jgi:hypothetical protein